jgi:hypothetical protein
MKERGYPAEDPGQVGADLSVTHAATLSHYRAAQEIRAAAERGDASTEDLRQALIHLRVVFGELLGKPDDAEPTGAVAGEPRVLAAKAQVPRSRVLNAGVPDGASRVPGGASRVPDGAGHVPDAAARDDTSSDGAARDDAVRAGAVRNAAVSHAAASDGAARDGAIANDPVRDGMAPDGAETPEPEEQLWRPGIRVPRARTSEEETQ